MPEGFHWETYKQALLFLGTAGVIVPLFRRLHLSPVLGFLAAGVLLGPYGLGRVASSAGWVSLFSLTNPEAVAAVGEFGVVFLLFMIGLELSWERLQRMRRLIFGLGAAQVIVCAAVLAALGSWLGMGPRNAIILGAALSLSSTAIAIPVLAERRRLTTGAGRTAFSILLFQDLMVAPLLFTVSILGAPHPQAAAEPILSDLFWTIAPAFVALASLLLLGRLVLRPLFHLVATAKSTELFMAACLFVVVGTSVATAAAGLSMALGAFIAGLLLAETEFRREIEVTIEPFQGLLLGLFFVSIGTGLDLSQVAQSPGVIVGFVVGVIAVKAAIIFLLARAFRLGSRLAGEVALVLAPGGEFAFVMIGAAIAGRVVPAPMGGEVMIIVTLSMFLLPLLGYFGAKLGPRQTPDEAALAALAPEADIGAGRVIIVGYGRVGQLVGQMLRRHDIAFVAIDDDPKLVARERQAGAHVYWGSAGRPEFLQRCGIAQAAALVVTINSPRAAEEIVATARAAHPDLTIVARARDAHHATVLYGLGVTDAIPETIEASLQLSEAVLVDIGVPMGHVIASIHERRDEYRRLLQPVAEAPRRARRAIRLSTRRKEAGKPLSSEAKREV
ncbi:MAG: cation:proton antiporter [Methylobacteriaceae bacterium]|nr:cation:proton antiporter [Methylobacteriaceae bacterium]